MPARNPATAASRLKRSRGNQGPDSATALNTIATTDTTWLTASGVRPACSRTWPSAENCAPKPRPAKRPLTTSARLAPRSPEAPFETSQMAGIAVSTPTTEKSAGAFAPEQSDEHRQPRGGDCGHGSHDGHPASCEPTVDEHVARSASETSQHPPQQVTPQRLAHVRRDQADGEHGCCCLAGGGDGPDAGPPGQHTTDEVREPVGDG